MPMWHTEVQTLQLMHFFFSEKMRKEWEKKAVQGAKTGSPPLAGGNRGSTQKSTEAMEKARKERLDRTSAEDRAKMDVYRKEMNDRRLQRGLPVRPRT